MRTVSGYFPPLVTLETFIAQVLSADHSCRDAVAQGVAQRLADGQAPCSSDTGGYCKARQRLPEALVMRLVQATGQGLEAHAEPSWTWQGRTVKLVDGTTVSMPDTLANQADYPQPPGQAPGVGFPQARLVGLIGLVLPARNTLDNLRHQRLADISPAKRLSQSLVEELDESEDALFQLFLGRKLAALEETAGQDAEPHFDLIQPGAMLGRIHHADTMAGVLQKGGARFHILQHRFSQAY